jgi:hypothetical protein
MRRASRVFIVEPYLYSAIALVLVDAWMFQWRLARELERCMRAGEMPNERPVRMSYGPKTSATGLIGRMETMRAGVSAVVIEGNDAAALRRGVGHIPERHYPADAETWESLDTGIRFPASAECQGDMISFTTSLEEYHYSVVSTIATHGRRRSHPFCEFRAQPVYCAGQADPAQPLKSFSPERAGVISIHRRNLVRHTSSASDRAPILCMI